MSYSNTVDCVEKLARRMRILMPCVLVVMTLMVAGCGGAEREIRKTLDRFAGEVSVRGEESLVDLVAKSRSLGNYFYDTCEIDVPEMMMRGDLSRQELVQMILGARGNQKELTVSLSQMEVESISDELARVSLVVRVRGSRGELFSSHDRGEIVLGMKKHKGMWQISSAAPLEVVRK